jgi:hypothetical protein
MHAEVAISQKKNEKVTKIIEEQKRELKGIKKQGAIARANKRNGVNVIAEESHKGSKKTAVLKKEEESENSQEEDEQSNTD